MQHWRSFQKEWLSNPQNIFELSITSVLGNGRASGIDLWAQKY